LNFVKVILLDIWGGIIYKPAIFMKLRTVLAGKIEENSYRSIIGEFVKKIEHYCPVEFIESKVSEKGILENKDITKLLDYGKDFYKIALDLKGRDFSTCSFADFFKSTLYNRKNVVFYIGGAFGLGEELAEKCDERISLSKLTLAHKVAAVVLMEQLYRAFTIISGHPYHK
jgi:23S rRNA (pseudouridine1915-N3)-methyltransferase